MKYANLFIMLLSSITFLNAQCTLEKIECYSLKASIDAEVKHHSMFSYVLEKQIISNVWKEIEQRNSYEKEVMFTDLEKEKTYRVTCLPIRLHATKKKTMLVKPHLAKQKVNQNADGFVSNSMTLNDCDNQTELTEFSYQKRKKNIMISPNPTDNILVVNGLVAEGNNQIGIYNLNGERLLLFEQYQNNNPIDVSNLLEGIYFLTVREGDKAMMTKKVAILRK